MDMTKKLAGFDVDDLELKDFLNGMERILTMEEIEKKQDCLLLLREKNKKLKDLKSQLESLLKASSYETQNIEIMKEELNLFEKLKELQTRKLEILSEQIENTKDSIKEIAAEKDSYVTKAIELYNKATLIKKELKDLGLDVKEIKDLGLDVNLEPIPLVRDQADYERFFPRIIAAKNSLCGNVGTINSTTVDVGTSPRVHSGPPVDVIPSNSRSEADDSKNYLGECSSNNATNSSL